MHLHPRLTLRLLLSSLLALLAHGIGDVATKAARWLLVKRSGRRVERRKILETKLSRVGRWLVPIIGCFAALVGSLRAAAPVVPVDLGTLGGIYSYALAVNDSGQVVGESLTAGNGGIHVFSWTQSGGMVDLGTLGGRDSFFVALNASGQVVGYSYLSDNVVFHAFSWTQSGGMVDLGTLPTGHYSRPFGPFSLNASGQVVGYSYVAFDAAFHAFSWTQSGGMVDLDTLGGGFSEAFAVNASGQVVGRSTPAAGSVLSQAFSWTQSGGMTNLTPGADRSSISLAVNDAGQVLGEEFIGVGGALQTRVFSWTQAAGLVALGTLGGSNSRFYQLNDNGQVVGDSSLLGDTLFHAFSWTQSGGMVDLGTLGGIDSTAAALNASGQVVGASRLAGNAVHHAFSWTQSGGMVDLGTLGGSFSNANFVNASGQVVGQSNITGNTDSHAFSWTQSGGMVDLGTLVGGTFSQAFALNASGQVVGRSTLTGNAFGHATLWRTVNNTAPTITAVGVTRQQDAGASNSLIATVSDTETAENELAVTVNGLPSATINGVTVSNIVVDSGGQVMANAAAACGATGASFTLRVTDTGSLFAQATLNVAVTLETTPPVINPIVDVIASLPLNSVATSMPVTFPLPTATDHCSGATVVTSPVSGTPFNVGTTTVNVTATDALGNIAQSSFTVTVVYNFAGFFQPVDNVPTFNTANAGQAIPVKFSLSGNKGPNIFAPGYPTSVPIPCPGGTGAPIEEIVANASGSFLQYDSGTDRYNYVWKTDQSWSGTCRQLIVKLNDGITYMANFQFK